MHKDSEPFSARLSTIGRKAFTVTIPRVWNTLTTSSPPPSVTIFCQCLKTWLFRQSYPDLII